MRMHTSYTTRRTPVAAGLKTAGSGNHRAVPPTPGLAADSPRTLTYVEAELRALLGTAEFDLPLPGGNTTSPSGNASGAGPTTHRWNRLAEWARHDLAFARVAEGHTDAMALLAEAGREPVAGALYGMWPGQADDPGAQLRRTRGALRVFGTVRGCSGARIVDRAVVLVDAERPAGGLQHQGAFGASPSGDASGAGSGAGLLLVDVAVGPPSVRPDPDSWQTAAMDASDPLDVDFADLVVESSDIVGDAGWYHRRPGYILGKAGLACVWWGGADGLLARAIHHLPAEPDAHQLAHLGELYSLLSAARALVAETGAAIDANPGNDHSLRVGELRSAVERVVREVVERVPRMLGSGPLSRDAELARKLADLALFARSHHGERDNAALGRSIVALRAKL